MAKFLMSQRPAILTLLLVFATGALVGLVADGVSGIGDASRHIIRLQPAAMREGKVPPAQPLPIYLNYSLFSQHINAARTYSGHRCIGDQRVGKLKHRSESFCLL